MTEFNHKKKLSDNDKLLNVKDAGDYMKPLSSFFDTVALEPPLSQKATEKLE
jgi:hypothetical protein